MILCAHIGDVILLVIRLLDDGHSDVELEAAMDDLIRFPLPRVVIQVVEQVKAQGLILLAIGGEVALLAALDDNSIIYGFRLAAIHVLAAKVRCVVAASFLRPIISLLARHGIRLFRFLGLGCHHDYVKTFCDKTFRSRSAEEVFIV
jgi:hypothetical protein